jgi:hypothetical protein
MRTGADGSWMRDFSLKNPQTASEKCSHFGITPWGKSEAQIDVNLALKSPEGFTARKGRRTTLR